MLISVSIPLVEFLILFFGVADFSFYYFLFSYVCACTISVGTNMGDVMVWEVGSRERIALRNFKVWDLGACSMPLQVWFLIHPFPIMYIYMCMYIYL